MPDRIGKYEIVERIGRGSMGTVYKARDTRLNRLVALKVVLPDVELTNELRARFLSEAQSFAGLSHPNIVTIYDAGEEDDRLYIVAELLEGQELKRMIADRVALATEEKVSLMIQLCDALAYAHDKGVIHQDIKPGNIFFQRTGPVKIIDFGIARIAAASSTTRTGSILGTLRYMSPEQARGSADQRSDQFSLAAVFYEMLGYRPPYLGEDPIQLLEQLRTETPPSLLELDPSLPPELVKVVERGMSKEPEARFADLRAMRVELEGVQRKLHEESERLRGELAPLAVQVRETETALSQRLGGPVFDGPAFAADSPAQIGALQQRIREARERLKALEECARKLESAERIVAHGKAALEAGNLPEAIRDFDTVVAEIPQFFVARSLLDRAQAEQETRRRRDKSRELLEEAERALQAKDATRCLALVQTAADMPAPPDAEEQIAALRREAKTIQSEIEASRRAKQQAELARGQVLEAKKLAETREAPGLAPEKWAHANTKLAEADRVFAAERFSESLLQFDTAVDAYVAAEEEARDRRDRQRREADEAKAAERFEKASALLAEVRKQFHDRAYVRCQELLRQIADIPTPEKLRAEVEQLSRETDNAVQSERKARKPAQQARMQMTALRVDAEAEGAPQRAAKTWGDAEAKSAAGAAEFQRELFAEAHQLFDEAAALYRRALEECRVAAAAAAAAATAATAAAAAATATAAAAEASRPSPPEPVPPKETATAVAADAGAAEKRRQAENARSLLDEALRNARQQADAKAAPALWSELEAKTEAGRAAFESGAYDKAFADYEAALVLCQRFEDAARTAAVVKAPASAKETPARAAGADEAAVVVPVIVPPSALPKDTRVADTASSTRPRDPKPGSSTTLLYGVVLIVLLSASAAWFVQSRSTHLDTAVTTRTTTEVQPEAPRIATEAEMAAALKAAEAKTAKESAPESAVAVSDAAAAATKAADDAKAAAQAKSEADAEAIAQVRAEFDAKAATEAKAEAAVKAAEFKAVEQARSEAEARGREIARVEAEQQAAQDKADAAASAKLEADAKAAKARAAADAKAAQAKIDAEAKAAQAKSDETSKAAAEARAAKAKADAEAKKQKEIELARARTEPPFPPVDNAPDVSSKGLTGAYAVVFTEGTDGKKGGGAWGACWRQDPSAARSCAKSACDKTRQSGSPCQEIAATSPGGHCAVARAAGYGVSWGVCSNSLSEARGGALAGCKSQVKKSYGNTPAICEVVWTTNK